ncbi:hypothetical protein D3C80_1919810 [compost metagenome]
MLARCRNHKVTESGQSGKGQRIGAKLDPYPGNLGKSAGKQRSLGIVTEAQTIRQPCSESDDIL